MNRSIALFVALAVLVAHGLAIRTDGSGSLAAPYDEAFVAFRVARNIAYEGSWSWNPGMSGFDSYPSTLWVLVCAACERLYLPINLWVRVIGVLAAATSFFLASRFHAPRAASLITPMLLAISGAMAAAAVSGTETALLTMLVTGSFLAFERHWDRALGLLLLLSGLTRAEGWILAAVFLLLRWRERTRARREGRPERPGIGLFALPAIGAAVMVAIHWRATGVFLAPWFESLLRVDNAAWGPGLGYLGDFFFSTASPALVAYSVWYFFRGRLSETGTRALLVFLVWSLLVVANGGGRTPFCESMVPVLPIVLISAQEGMIIALNSTRRAVRALAWASFLGAVLGSAAVSLSPRDDLPEPIAGLHRRWMRPSSTPRYGFEDRLGRRGLEEEMAGTEELRAIGLYMRDQLDPRRTVLTPWPGSIAYLSDLPVIDLQGRATPAPGADRPRPRAVSPRVDVLAAMEAGPDHIAPVLRPGPSTPTISSIAADWCERLDAAPATQARLEAVERALEAYELITIPLPGRDRGIAAWRRRSILLRRRDLGLTPRLHATYDEGILTVQAEHRGPWQLADLSIVGLDDRGRERCLSPTGRFLLGSDALARSGLLLAETGDRPTTLMRCRVGSPGAGIRVVTVALRNPGASGRGPSALVSEEIRLEIE